MVLQPARLILQKLAEAFEKFMEHVEAALDIQLRENSIAMESSICKLWGTSRKLLANRVKMQADEKKTSKNSKRV